MSNTLLEELAQLCAETKGCTLKITCAGHYVYMQVLKDKPRGQVEELTIEHGQPLVQMSKVDGLERGARDQLIDLAAKALGRKDRYHE